MVRAEAAEVHYHYQDHDTERVAESPPVQNTWYEAFHEDDVRLLWCVIYQANDEAAAKDIEVRWTIDGNVYFVSVSLASGTNNWVYRNYNPSSGGTSGLVSIASEHNAARFVDKRGLDFKVEARMTSVAGTNQSLYCNCVKETEVQT